ncbi:PqqD family protein [Paenibacillus sp. R14(2021)]|uniref:PqqD family protein n=1 Tax=Paenibacillus sp. R14(2021) TaxID=2859228 RepID=UPI001C611302|nr:PqqD family protein [Paenibacillus sp. R14(2021)]
MKPLVDEYLKLMRCNTNIETTELDGEWILMNVETHAVTKLNEIGGLIWSNVDECRTVEALAVRIANEGDAPLHAVLADVDRVVGEMLVKGLLTLG